MCGSVAICTYLYGIFIWLSANRGELSQHTYCAAALCFVLFVRFSEYVYVCVCEWHVKYNHLNGLVFCVCVSVCGREKLGLN